MSRDLGRRPHRLIWRLHAGGRWLLACYSDAARRDHRAERLAGDGAAVRSWDVVELERRP